MLAPDIPRGQIGGMRNALVHAYVNIDWDAVSLVVVRDLSRLEPALRALALTLEQRWISSATPSPSERARASTGLPPTCSPQRPQGALPMCHCEI